MNKAALVSLVFLAGCATGKSAGVVNPFALPEKSDKSPTSVEYQIASMGSANLGSLYRIEFDPESSRRLRQVGDRITRYCERADVTYRYEMLDTKQLQAISLPDGSIFVSRGMLQLLETDDELAAVLSHEVAHVTHRHILKTYERAVSGGRILGGVVASIATALVGMPALGIEFVQAVGERGYLPKQELQADVTALRYMRRCDYDPDIYPAVLKKIAQHALTHPDAVPAQLSKRKTHPNVGARLAFIQQALERVKREEPVLYKAGDSPL